jgi:hypothetical protein
MSNSDPLQAALALSTGYGEGAIRSAPILSALVPPLGVITSGLSGLHSILLPGRALEPTAPINARVEHALWSSLCRRSRAHCEPRRGLLHRTVKHRVRRRAVDLRFFSGGNSSLSTRRADEVSPLHRAAPLPYRVRARNARIRAMRAITKTPLLPREEHQNRDLPYTVE